MKLYSILKLAIKSIMSNKLRSALTMLGLIIGIASVIVLVGIGNGASTQVKSQVQSLGTDIVTVSISSSDESLEYENLDEVQQIDNVESTAPYKTISGTVARGDNSTSQSKIMAVNNNYLDITNTYLQKGRTISIIDIENSNKVCILGSDIAETLFSLTDPIGEKIKIDGDYYTVIRIVARARHIHGEQH